MTPPTDPITDADLQAYVDEQLDVPRRIEVEAHLSHHPTVAARIMSDLRTRDELRLALADRPTFARIATGEAARRLERGLTRSRLLDRFRRIAALLVVGAIGWTAHAQFGATPIGDVIASTPPPPFVEEAVMAHRTTLVRAGMPSQPEIAAFDRDEIRAATGIVLPALPERWRIADVQIFPSKFGPSVEMSIRTDASVPLSLFAVRPGAFDVRDPASAAYGDMTAAYWQIGDVAYALVAETGAPDLDRAAEGLARTLY